MAHALHRLGGEYLAQALGISVLLALAVNATPSRGLRDAPSLYEPSGIQIVSGEVARVDILRRAGGAGRDVTVIVKMNIGDEVPVAVAPQWVLKALGLRLHHGDPVQVVGWRIVTGKPAVLAAEISKGSQRFVFRDRYGAAVWGPRRRLKR